MPATNLEPLAQADLGRNIFVFVLGFVVIFVGIFLAKKLKVIGGTIVSKNDRKLVDKAKRALGISPSLYGRHHPVS